ncbi:hypothetical protein L0Z42_12630 [Burkholderia multivorans]|uniref:hypothetical protein n=1 Tax=Burkholderia multivorans TaxID=87883 RepID=UPI00201841C5|nr:hypothetical protein [Burkholderia multivorans]MCO1371387.1 hypothetical protein [Burkholderia multivorans]MCO1457364.1 hypothetical protein [Burkholderia multivorans]MCO1466351.1 hypothetical protein [Burkholderia multivorans]UQO15957.1 hypothetical protein L0Z02_10075 [Burkholderia multivorans]UQO86677.1 hypothetical protein L0Y86_16390 [Burkholderia multivorans]
MKHFIVRDFLNCNGKFDEIRYHKRSIHYRACIMGDRNNGRKTHVIGNNNVIGDNNVVNSNNRTFTTNNYRVQSSSNSDDAAGMGFGVVAAVLLITWKFVKNADVIYHQLQQATLLSALPTGLALLISPFVARADAKRVVACIFGLMISLGAYFVSIYAQANLPHELIDFSQRATDAVKFWKGLPHELQNIVTGSFLSALAIGASAIFSFLMGLFIFWDIGLNCRPAELYRILGSFRPSRGGVLGAFFLLIAILLSSGLFLQFWDSLQSSRQL